MIAQQSPNRLSVTSSPSHIKQSDVEQVCQEDIDSDFEEHFDNQRRQLSKIVTTVNQNYQAAAMQRKEKELESIAMDDTQVSKPFYTTVPLTPPMNVPKVQQLSPLVPSKPTLSQSYNTISNTQKSEQTPMIKSIAGFNSELNTIEEATFQSTNSPRQEGDDDEIPAQTSNILAKYAGEQYQKKMRKGQQNPINTSQELPTVYSMGQRSGSMQMKPSSSLLPEIARNYSKKQKNASDTNLVSTSLAPTVEIKTIKKKRNQTATNSLRTPFNIPKQKHTPVLKQKHGGPYGFPPSKFDRYSHYQQSKSFNGAHSQELFKKRKSSSSSRKKPTNKLSSKKIEFQYYPVKQKKFKNGCYYNGQWKGKKMHGRGVLIFPNGTRYAGQFKEGCAEGYGEKFWPDGRSYKGYWKQNKMHGKGELMALTMDLYIGGFRNGFPHGHGIRRWPNGDIYEGQYKIGYQDGVGTFISIEQGWKYMGDWAIGMMQGRAVCQWSDGTIYQGGWAGCLKQGDGILTYSDGTIVQGQFKADLPNGIGRKIFPDSSYYNGTLVNGMFHGYGNFRWNDGSQFQGNWNNNQIKGKGTWKFANGVIIQGNFEKQSVNGQAVKKIPDPEKGSFLFRGMMKKGRYEGMGQFRWPDGRHFIGNFKNERMHGKGKLVFPDHYNGKAVYKGDFIDNEFDGQGKLQFSNGDTYSGLFRAGAFHGYGIFSQLSGKIVYQGQFIKNVSHGKGKLSTPQVQFEGYFNGGLLQKKGKAIYKNGDQYFGTFKKSQMNGYGCYRYADGVKLIGVFEQGQIYNGKKVYPDGRIYMGQLLHETQNGKGIVLSKYGEKSAGLWEKGKLVEQITDMANFNFDYDKMNEEVSFSSSRFVADDTREQNLNEKSAEVQEKYGESIKKIEEALASQSEKEEEI